MLDVLSVRPLWYIHPHGEKCTHRWSQGERPCLEMQTWDLFSWSSEVRRWPTAERREQEQVERGKRTSGEFNRKLGGMPPCSIELTGGKNHWTVNRVKSCPKGPAEWGCVRGDDWTHQNIIGVWGQNPRNEQKENKS